LTDLFEVCVLLLSGAGSAAVLGLLSTRCWGQRNLWTAPKLRIDSESNPPGAQGKEQAGNGKQSKPTRSGVTLRERTTRERAASIFKGKLYDLYTKYGRTAVVTYVGLDITTSVIISRVATKPFVTAFITF
jgi:hypothetical protein